MEKILQIENACRADDKEMVRQILASLDSDALKEEAFHRITGHYEDRGLFPAGYVLMFIKWLIQKKNVLAADEYIGKALREGVPEAKVSKIIYEYLIKPDESRFRERFRRNLEILKRSGVFLSGMNMDFEMMGAGGNILRCVVGLCWT